MIMNSLQSPVSWHKTFTIYLLCHKTKQPQQNVPKSWKYPDLLPFWSKCGQIGNLFRLCMNTHPSLHTWHLSVQEMERGLVIRSHFITADAEKESGPRSSLSFCPWSVLVAAYCFFYFLCWLNTLVRMSWRVLSSCNATSTVQSVNASLVNGVTLNTPAQLKRVPLCYLSCRRELLDTLNVTIFFTLSIMEWFLRGAKLLVQHRSGCSTVWRTVSTFTEGLLRTSVLNKGSESEVGPALSHELHPTVSHRSLCYPQPLSFPWPVRAE